MPLEVIGAGFGRTGTTSLTAALNQLGLGPCYHMGDCFKNGHFRLWTQAQAALRRGDAVDFERFFSTPKPPYRSSCDFPSSLYYKELLKAYPDAKVILTVRDSADAWYDSCLRTIFSADSTARMRRMALVIPNAWGSEEMISKLVLDNPDLFDGKFHSDPAFVKEVYFDWIEEVKRSVPAEKLLVFNPKDGWGPLCTFLGVPVPDAPYPHKHTTKSHRVCVSSIDYGLMAVGALLLAAVAVAVGWLVRQRG